jgi:tetratricopeptide (TPR) repeat protein
VTFNIVLRAFALAAGLVTATAAMAQGRNATFQPLGATPTFRDALRASVYGNVLAARLAATVRDTATASVYWRAALRQDPRNNEILERAFVTTLADGNIDEAVPLAERLIQIDRGHRLARLALAMRAMKARQYQAARNHLNAAPRAGADLTSALLVGWSQLGSGDANAGIAAIDRLTGADWYALFKNFHAGLILDAAGRRTDAGLRLQEAYKQDPTILRIVDAYGRWASRAKSADEARQIFAAYDKVIPGHPIITDAQRRLGGDGATLPMLVRTPQTGAAEVLYGLGSALSRQGGEDLALIYLQLARWLDPQHDLAILSLADLYEFLKVPGRAITVFDAMPESSPLYRNAQIQRALNLDQMERTDEARKALEDLTAKYPNDLEAIQALGNVLRGRKQFAEAAEAYSKALALIPSPTAQHWIYFYFRGIAYERTKQWSKAEADLKRALELIPESNTRGRAQVLNYLGYSWVDQGLNLEEGLAHIRKAVELTPEDGYIVDSLGWAYYRMGRFEEAVVELERAIELRPEDPVINDHLGDAYWRTGRQLEAQFQWNHARDLKPEPDDLPRILQKIASGLSDDREPAARTTTGQAAPQSAPN